RESHDLGQAPAVARLGENAQPLGKEKPLQPPRLLVPERAQALDGRVGKGGDLAGHGPRASRRHFDFAQCLLSMSGSMFTAHPEERLSLSKPRLEGSFFPE